MARTRPKNETKKSAKSASKIPAKTPALSVVGADKKSSRYDRILARATTANLEASRHARDIASGCPEIEDRARRNAAFASLREFLEVYFERTFPLAWSEDQLKIIDRLQEAIETGGQQAVAAPRGSGKTAIFQRAALWGVLTGRRRYIVTIAATEKHAEKLLSGIKSELEHNDLLLADFPKACYPIRKLESQSRRCVGQLWDGERTCVVWQRKDLVLPTVPGPDNEASGAVLAVAGITGAIRGLHHVTPHGETIRPDLALIDDPSTRESADSFIQNGDRLATIRDDVTGLAGPGKSISMLAAVTVIKPRDLADRLLDRDEHPEWNGERFKMVYRWPDREDLWREYERIRAEGMRAGDRGRAGNEFYLANRIEMERGAVVAWPQRFAPGEFSAIQHAYHLKFKLGDGFDAEYQNEPIVPAEEAAALDPVAIANRCGGYERGVAPPESEKVTAFVDVGSELLWWMVCGWSDAFDCAILDYGTFPEQNSRLFLARSASPGLSDVFPAAATDAERVYAGLEALVPRLAGRDWHRSDGASLDPSRILIDSGWASEAVRLFIRQSPHRNILTPSKGFGFKPSQNPIAEAPRKDGEKRGDGWILGAAGPDRLRLVRFDANLHKSRLAGMLTAPMGGRGVVTLCGRAPTEHELLALHLSSEFPTRTEARGNVVDVWDRRPDRENHWWDCLIGNAIAAGLEGLSPLVSIRGNSVPARKKVSGFAAMRQRHGRQSPPP